ncbi:MAG: CDP-alcohol phosphatidyltransferase family protein [bacterium]|nr:CDP-alcohol phosphatidyltransferase family protein [bacterium]
MLLNFIHDQGRKLLHPFVKLLASLSVKPATISIAGFLLCLLASIIAWTGHYWQAGLVFTIGSLFDALDGGVARLTGTVSKAGAALDSSLDRVAEAALFTALLAGTAGTEHPALLYAAPLALTGSFMVSYVRARAEGLGIPCEVGFFTRMERLIAMIAALFLADMVGSIALLLACALVALGAWATAVQRLLTVFRAKLP